MRPVGVGVPGAPTATGHCPAGCPSCQSVIRRPVTLARISYGVRGDLHAGGVEPARRPVGPVRQQHPDPVRLPGDDRQPGLTAGLRRAEPRERGPARRVVHGQGGVVVDDGAVSARGPVGVDRRGGDRGVGGGLRQGGELPGGDGWHRDRVVPPSRRADRYAARRARSGGPGSLDRLVRVVVNGPPGEGEHAGQEEEADGDGGVLPRLRWVRTSPPSPVLMT